MTYHQLIPEGTMTKEPVMAAATIVSLVGSVVALLIAFGVDLTQEQQAAIVGLTNVVAPLVAAVIVRAKVTPTP